VQFLDAAELAVSGNSWMAFETEKQNCTLTGDAHDNNTRGAAWHRNCLAMIASRNSR
jgi:hypothetical protein